MTASLTFAAAAMQGRLLGPDACFASVSTDSRTLDPGALFVALSGPRFDGSDYLAAAAARGAIAAVVHESRDSSLSQVLVGDTRRALGRLGAALRERCTTTTVVGITGSNGKTTLKELTAACLARVGRTLATEGNLNNDIGVPLMLSRIEQDHDYAVIEMGASRAGEIAYLAALARPELVALTNAGPAHLEGFGSLDGVSRAKGELLRVRPRPRAAVLNADDRYFADWCRLGRDLDVLSFGLGRQADVTAVDVALDSDGSRFELRLPGAAVDVRLSLTGEHNVRNACAAAAIAHLLGVSAQRIAAGLGSVEAVGGRLRTRRGQRGARLFDDSYNANPASAVAAARFLAAAGPRHIFVLGDMRELGPAARELTRACGADIRHAGVTRLFALGELSRAACEGFGDGATRFADREQLVTALKAELCAELCVLVKGSRSTAMERVVDALLADGEVR